MSALPAAVLFDLDGTLTNTVPLIARNLSAAITRWGTPVAEGDILPYIGRPLSVTLEDLAGIGPEDEGYDVLVTGYRGTVNVGVEEEGPKIVLPGAVELLRRLRDADVLVGIVTAKDRAQAEHLLHHSGLADGVQDLVATDDVARGKPFPDPALLGADRLGVAPSACWYVGDATTDVEMAIAAGMPCYGVTTGAATREELEDAGAVAVVDRIDALWDVWLR